MSIPETIGKYTIEYLLIETNKTLVYNCIDTTDQTKCAMKITKDKKIHDQYELLKQINHPNIIKAIDFIQFNDFYGIIFPRANDDLNEFMLKLPYPLSEQKCRIIMKDLLSAVQYLHSSGIWHRNITIDNVLVFMQKNEEKYALGGFSYAEHFTQKISGAFGASQYLAPEVIEGKEYDNKIDCWSLGVVMYSILTQNFPYEEQYNQNKQVDFAGISPVAQDLITHLLCVDPEARYSAEQALNHSFFSE